MKTATLIVRTLIGLLFLYTSLSFFLKLAPEPVTNGDFKAFQIGTMALDYLMPMAKSLELLCGISFLTGKFVSLSNIVILPVTLNIVCFTYFVAPDFLAIAIIVFLGNLFLISRYWKNYKPIFTP